MKLYLFNYKNIKKFLLYCHTLGILPTINLVFQKLHKANIHLEPTITPLSFQIPIETDFQESLKIIPKIVTVVIPTKNAGPDFKKLLKKIKCQKGLQEIEIIIVDSGSTDKTLEIAQNEKVKVVEIPPEDFNHGYSRNKGAEHAEGDYVLFTVQDALPLTDRWIWELVMALEKNDVTAVSCAEYPRSDCDLFYQWMIWNHYRTLNLDQDRILEWDGSCGTYLGLRSNSQINNVAALIKRDIFLKYGFRKKYAEDLDLGIRLIMDGRRIAFLYSTRILHSHNRPAYYFLKRSYVDTKFLYNVFADFPLPKIKNPQRLFGDMKSLFLRTKKVASYLATVNSGRNLKTGDLIDHIVDLYYEDSGTIEASDTVSAVNDLGNFIQKLDAPIKDDQAPFKYNENIILPHFLDSIKALHAFVSQSREEVNGCLAHELETALFKMLALNCGAYIAYLYLNHIGNRTEELFPADLDKELSAGI